MRVINWFLAAFLCCGSAIGATVTGSFKLPSGVPLVTNVTFTPQTTPFALTTNIYATVKTVRTSNSGLLSVPLVEGTYKVQVAQDTFYILVPSGTTTNDITTLIVSGVNTPSTVTNVLVSAIMTTKGDLMTHNGTNVVRLGVGTDDQIPVADSTASSGIAWKTVAGVAGAASKAYLPINVKEDPYNAVGDGVADDTAALQAAINAAAASLKSVFFPSGVYLISDTLDATGWNPYGVGLRDGQVKWTGEGHNQPRPELRFIVEGKPCVELQGSGYVAIEGLSFNSQSNATAGIIFARTTTESSGVHSIRNVRVTGKYSVSGVMAVDSELNHYDHCFFEVSSGDGVAFTLCTTNTIPLNEQHGSIGTAGSNVDHLFSMCSFLNYGTNAALVLDRAWEATFNGLYVYTASGPGVIMKNASKSTMITQFRAEVGSSYDTQPAILFQGVGDCPSLSVIGGDASYLYGEDDVGIQNAIITKVRFRHSTHIANVDRLRNCVIDPEYGSTRIIQVRSAVSGSSFPNVKHAYLSLPSSTIPSVIYGQGIYPMPSIPVVVPTNGAVAFGVFPDNTDPLTRPQDWTTSIRSGSVHLKTYDTSSTMAMLTTGSLYFGDGTNAVDTRLYRYSTNFLVSQGDFQVNEDLAVQTNLTVGGQSRLYGNVIIGDTDVVGLRVNILTTAERDALTPSSGSMIFNTTMSNFQGYNGTAWNNLIGVDSSDTPSDGQVPKWNTGGTITWEDDNGGSAPDYTLVGPGASVTARQAAVFSDTSGTNIVNTPVTIDAGGNVDGVADFTMTGTLSMDELDVGDVVVTNGVSTGTNWVGSLQVTNWIQQINATGSRVAIYDANSRLTNAATTGLINGTGAAATLANVTNALGLTGSTSTYLRSDGTQATPAGGGGETSGTVHSGGALTTDNALVRADGTTGTNVQSSVVILDDNGGMTGVGALNATNITARDWFRQTNVTPGYLAVYDNNKYLTNSLTTEANILTESEASAAYQPLDTDLTTWAGITPGANVGTFLATPSSANLRAALTDESGTGAAVFAGGDIGAATATTASANDDDTSVATTAFVTSSTTTFTGKTFDAAGTGNVLKQYGYIVLTHPARSGSDALIYTNDSSQVYYGQATFSNSAATNNNYAEYRLTVPEDIDTSVDLVCSRFKFYLGNTDTATHGYTIGMDGVADSAASATLAQWVSLAFAGDGSGASGDVETVSATTLTSWKDNLTAGQLWVIRVNRDGPGTDVADASTVNSYSGPIVIRYGKTQ